MPRAKIKATIKATKTTPKVEELREVRSVLLKTIAKLRADLGDAETACAGMRTETLRLHIEVCDLRAQAQRDKISLAALFMDIRNIAATKHDDGVPLPLTVRLQTMVCPATMLRAACRLTQGHIWAKIVARLNEHTFKRNYEKPITTTATTVRVEKNTAGGLRALPNE